jgi:hypothetical protein
VADENGAWTLAFTLPDSATMLQLTDRAHRRLIVLDPRRDEAPTVRLRRPERDTTVRAAPANLGLDAEVADDIRHAAAWFEYVVTTGESEGQFDFTQGRLGARRFADASGRLSIVVPLAGLRLKEGDQLQVRAVAVDGNTVSGPDTGYSETRTLRVARRGEYDSLAIEGAPPPSDTAVMTLRYVIQLTEELIAKRQRIPRDTFVEQSAKLGDHVRRLIAKVDEMNEEFTFGGLFPPNAYLLTAREALYDGMRLLNIAEPAQALPPLWTALRALQKFGTAKRYYVRGRLNPALVNIERVRLTGTDSGRASPRGARESAEAERERLRRTFVEALTLLRTAPDRAADLLTEMQVTALRRWPPLAAALGEAAAAVRAGRQPALPLGRARRMLEGPVLVRDTLRAWSTTW